MSLGAGSGVAFVYPGGMSPNTMGVANADADADAVKDLGLDLPVEREAAGLIAVPRRLLRC